MADEKAIIIVKKKGGHGGHHGGAWKVAYADFVTAMMAFFMVMWLVNSAESSQQQAIASYFRKPGLFESGSGVPILTGNAGILPDAYAPNLATPERKFVSGMKQVPMTKRSGEEDSIKPGQSVPKGEAGRGVIVDGKTDSSGFGLKENSKDGKGKGSDPLAIEKIKEAIVAEINKQLAGIPELTKLLGSVDIKIDADGINIEIMDSATQSMFEVASSTINPLAKAAFYKIAEVLKTAPNQIEIAGHTDARPYGRGFKGYTNWELSSDRANSARRLLEEAGIPAERITSVLGKADRELKVKEDPLSERNRRISLKIKFPTSMTISEPDRLAKALAAADEPKPAKEDKVHSFTAEDILKKQKERSQSTVTLPSDDLSADAKASKQAESSAISDVLQDFPVIEKFVPFTP